MDDPIADAPAGTPDDELSSALVDSAREVWIRRLIDHSRANSLLFYRDLKIGTLDLGATPEALERLLAGRALELDDLVPPTTLPESQLDLPDTLLRRNALEEEARRKTQHVLVAIQRKALSNAEEKGLDTLFVAVGMCSWPAADGGRPYNAPVLLLPARLEARGRIGEAIRLTLAGEPQPNLVLLYVLEHDFGIRVTAEELVRAAAEEDEEGAWRIRPEPATELLLRTCTDVREFEIKPRAVLGNFQFAKMAMVEDLRRHGRQLAAHPIIAAIAGHAPSRRLLAEAATEDIDPRELDRRPADAEMLVLDADSSQQRVIARAARGQSGVVQGPPGTGKSQTIANLIAELSARGERVLFVAEKRAALDAVVKRLEERGLEHLVLDLHGASVSRKEVMEQVSHALERIHEAAPVRTDSVHPEFENRRSRLNDHAARMNTPRGSTGHSVHELQGRLLRVPAPARGPVRWRGEEFARLTPERAHAIGSWLAEAGVYPGLFLGNDPSPWNDARIQTGLEAQGFFDVACRTAHELWPAFARALDQVRGEGVPRQPASLEEARALRFGLEGAAQLLEEYEPSLFEAPGDLAEALEPAGRGRLHVLWAFVTDGRFRAARRRLRRARRSPAGARALRVDALRAVNVLRSWTAFGASGPPRALTSRHGLSDAIQSLADAIGELQGVVQRLDLSGTALSDLGNYLTTLAADATTPYRLPAIYELRRRVLDAGVGRIIDDLRSTGVPPELWSRRFEHAWLHSALDAQLVQDPDLAAFNGRLHERYVEEFIRLDEERIRLAADRVRRLHGEHAIAAMNQHPDQTELIRREANKKSRHIPLRQLLARAPDVLTRVMPCWVASPLSVSQLLDGGQRHFDIVIFDEASQVLQEEAIPSILRGERVIVAGDRHQLPPTTFFTTTVEGEDVPEMEDEETARVASAASEAIGGFESLLDTLAVFLPNWMLEWHYRSEDERLIAFSNHHIYDDRLVSFPSARADEVISHILVEHNRGAAGQEDSASPEVLRVVELVIEHAQERPHETLGVIAMGIKHAIRVEAELDRALELRPELADYFAFERTERFFVKNLETVQGDERDAIILTVGYGKTSEGDLPHRFGPLTQESGHRRLNVAITRARRRLTVVSSFSHYEVDLNRSGSLGVQLLKAYIEYAASGGSRLPRSTTIGEVALNPFEDDIKDALEARGMNLLPQYGVSHYRIDLVALHPERPGRPVLAIECDGASYHRGSTCRDRDRLRQQQLMRLGWRFHRVWSTDWFLRRDEEIERALAAFQDAVRHADLIDAGGAPSATGAQATEGRCQERAPLRGPAPVAWPRHPSIDDYSDAELLALARWGTSDGLLRIDADLIREMSQRLGFQRLGARIRERLARALARALQQRGQRP